MSHADGTSTNSGGAARGEPAAAQDWESLYRDTFDHVPIGIAQSTLDGRFQRVNAVFAAMLGYTPQEMEGMPVATVTLPDERAITDDVQRRLLANEIPIERREKRYVRKDGALVWTSRTLSVRRDAHGKPLHFIGVVEDISERRNAELALNLALEAADMGVWVWDLRGDRIVWSPECCRIFGVAASPNNTDEIVARIHRDDRDRVIAILARAKAERRVDPQEFRIVRPNGEIRWLTSVGRAYSGSGADGVFGVVQDITDRKRIEQQYLQAQKMEAFGQLAGGVAHDFNNVLAVVIMHLNLMALDPQLPAKAQQTLKTLERATTRATSLVRQLLIFSRRQEIEIRPLELNRAVGESCQLLQRVVGEHLAFTCKPAPEPLWVEADAGMIEQVVMNLCVNARDAMPNGGALTVELRSEPRVKPMAGLAERRDYACLAVSDTGQGMDEALRQRIFEPFFTTKPVGRGTGLGLATVQTVAEQHGGWVEVDSEPGKGSTFRVYLPLGRAASSAEPPAPAAWQQGTARVLLVEDDEAVRLTVGECLRHVGYRVTEAVDAAAALERWDEAVGEFDLVITDVVMPGPMTGYQLVVRLRQANPQLKAVIITGYAGQAERPAALAQFPCTELAKPFSALALLEKVRSALHSM